MINRKKKRPILNKTSRIGIINRGEAAIRFIRAVEEFNSLYRTNISTIAFYLDIEQEALFVKEANEAFPLSPMKGFPENQGTAYLNRELMMEALLSANCQAVWVGWGFLAEDAVFAEMIEKAGLVFLGPSSQSMTLLGNKIAAKKLAEQAQVQVIPWSKGPVKDIEDAHKVSEQIGYPLIVKAAAAGGGRGIRFVRTAKELDTQYLSAKEETIRTTGNDIVFIEHLVVTGRHLEVQVLADRYGNVRTFGVRDCSVQRRNQKIIEETPPPQFKQETMRKMEDAAAKLIRAANYESAGTVEFLYDVDTEQFYFMEVNTRLQVEHPITEQLYNTDFVKDQILVAAGEKLEQNISSSCGAAIEVRLNAEDPDNDFIPAPGRVVLFKIPAGPGIRVDSGIEQGSVIPAEFDSMIAKIITYGPNRNEALACMERALREIRIKVDGGTSNRSFLLGLLNCPQIRRGGVTTQFVEGLLKSRGQIIRRDNWDIALMACAIEQQISSYLEELTNFKQQWKRIGQPRDIPPSKGHEVMLKVDGHTYLFLVKALADNVFHLKINGLLLRVQYLKHGHEALMLYNNKRYTIQTVFRGDTLQCEVDGTPYAVKIKSSDFIKSPFPALCVSLAVMPGQVVKKGDLLLELEAMKLVMRIEAPKTGRVDALCIKEGQQVAAGQPLIRMDKADHMELKEAPSQQRVCFQQPAITMAYQWQIMESAFLAVFLGYDYTEKTPKLLQSMLTFVKKNPSFQQNIIQGFLEVMEVYVAVENLFSYKQIETEGFAGAASYQELLMHFFIRNECQKKGLPQQFLDSLERTIKWYPQKGTNEEERFNKAFFRIYKSHAHLKIKQEVLLSTLYSMKELPNIKAFSQKIFDLLDEIAQLTLNQTPALADAAIQARYHLLDGIFLQTMKEERRAELDKLTQLRVKTNTHMPKQAKFIDDLINTGHFIVFDMVALALNKDKKKQILAIELLGKYFNRDRKFISGEIREKNELLLYHICSIKEKEDHETLVVVADDAMCEKKIKTIHTYLNETEAKTKPELIFLVSVKGTKEEEREKNIIQYLYRQALPVCWCCLGLFYKPGVASYHTFTIDKEFKWREDLLRRSFNPLFYRELKVYLLANFNLKILYSSESVFLVSAIAKNNQNDARLFALADIAESRAEFNEFNSIQRIVAFDYALMEAIYALSVEQSKYKRRLFLNRIIIHVHSLLSADLRQIKDYIPCLAPRGRGLGLEKVIIYTRRKTKKEKIISEFEIHFTNIFKDLFSMRTYSPVTNPIEPMTNDYISKVVRSRQRGYVYPYEIIKMITNTELGYPTDKNIPFGNFEEFDIKVNEGKGDQEFFSVKARPYGLNSGNIIFGIITSYTKIHSYGLKRVLILVDTTVDMGSLSEKECRRIIGALDLAQQRQLPVEWLPISAGAKIDMSSGTENLDWTARSLRRIIEFTQAGGEINLILCGVNVGAQSYWNAEATMLMHTKGILIMTEDASMLLTGKKALDFSGGVSAEDNIGIGGVEKIMGPNGQAQMRVKNLSEAYALLFQHYTFTYKEPGEAFPQRQTTTDKPDRDIGKSSYIDRLNQGFFCIRDIFSQKTNPERKKPFDMRQVMMAVIDQDAGFLERWQMMRNAETTIVWETRLGGYAVGLLGIESKPLARLGKIPHDGPEAWSGGTLFPLSSKKLARAVNAFSRHLPLIILANLSGFDGSPESLRKLQLEFGAEIGRAIVNFQGPIIFVVMARYHGGAYVVFSRALNPFLHAIALKGTYASVIGGAPAAAVIFSREVLKDTYSDPRIIKAQNRLKEDKDFSKKDFDDFFQKVHSEKQTALAQHFDQIHSIERAKKVGSINDIISLKQLRPYLIKAIEEGTAKYIDFIRNDR